MINNNIGNILDDLDAGLVNVVAHGVNCVNGFGSGIAGQIAERYPKVKEAFHSRCFKLGDIQIVAVGLDKWIINCATQFYCGGSPERQPNGMYCDYEAIETCMKKVKLAFGDAGLKVAVPWIGAGLAGGEWKYIESIIARTFADSCINIYKFKASQSELDTIARVIALVEALGLFDMRDSICQHLKVDGLVLLPHVTKTEINGIKYLQICKMRFSTVSEIYKMMSKLKSIINNHK